MQVLGGILAAGVSAGAYGVGRAYDGGYTGACMHMLIRMLSLRSVSQASRPV